MKFAIRLTSIFIILCIVFCVSCIADRPQKDFIVLAYVESGRKSIPDANLMTHIIYAFGVFNDNNDGIEIPTPEKLKQLSYLKNDNSKLKVILGIGGYKRGGFSEMAQSPKKRKNFVKSCLKIIKQYDLDGVDLDWEFPTTEAGGHTASPNDDFNYVLVVRELRKKLGKDKWISVYSNNSARWIDFSGMLQYIDYVNVSGYNLRIKEGHQSNLYSSIICGDWSVEKSVKKHISKGVPSEKILLGVPFFGRGRDPFPSYVECPKFEKYNHGTTLKWDNQAKAPYYVDDKGNLVLGFDSPESLEFKCDFIKENKLGGIFYWNYDGDYTDHRLAETIKKKLDQKSK